METISFELVGDVTVQVTITDNGDGTLTFDLVVDESTGTIGDLNGLFFDITGDTIPSGLTITGTDVTETAIKEGSVSKVDSYNNVNGEVVKEYDKFDVGVQFGTQGMAQDDIQSTSFTLSADEPLSLDMFALQDFAVRLTSVGEIDGDRSGSSKIGGESGEVVDPEPEVEHIANDDTMTVSSVNGFDPFGIPDTLDGLVLSLLENDTTDGGAYTGDVLQGNGIDLGPDDGDPTTYDLEIAGTNGGLLRINADGTVDFSANNEFNHLAVDETDVTTFEYGIEGGDTATLTVTVFGFDPDGGGGGGGGIFPL